MPLQHGVVGPVPPDSDPEEYDKLRRRVLWTMPSGLYVLGTRAGERRNGMTVNWTTQVASDPKLLAVSVEHEAFSHELLAEGGVFALNLIAQDDRAIVRKFTKPVDVDIDAATLNGYPYVERVTGAPILADRKSVV
jgi:flavin reductase (DIM6/NTAB) family NADH-FMN oxidoreductase RutF